MKFNQDVSMCTFLASSRDVFDSSRVAVFLNGPVGEVFVQNMELTTTTEKDGDVSVAAFC